MVKNTDLQKKYQPQKIAQESLKTPNIMLFKGLCPYRTQINFSEDRKIEHVLSKYALYAELLVV